MLLCEVVGTVIATAKVDALRGAKLLLVRERLDDGSLGRELIATDSVGAGTGELVLVARGSAARATIRDGDTPTDAAIVAIVDAVERGNQTPAQKRALAASAQGVDAPGSNGA